MRSTTHTLAIVVAIAVAALVTGDVDAQTTDVRRVEIVSVDGSTLVVRSQQGTERLTVTDDFRITVDGRQVTVGDLKPGMAGTARITTTTTPAPAQQSTDVKEGTIVKRSGTSVVARLPEGEKTYTDEELAARNIPVTVDGKPVRMSSLWEGTKLIETTVTTTPEQAVTQRRVDLTLESPRVAAAEPTPNAAPDPVPLLTRAEPEPAPALEDQLPATASPLAAVGLLGTACLAAGLFLTIRRRQRSGGQFEGV